MSDAALRLLETNITYPPPPEDRPYVFINMVTTIDGKSVLGDRDDTVTGLGSEVDRQLMRRIEASADGILVGARTLRATSPRWNPACRERFVVTQSGDLPYSARFFTEGPSTVVTSSRSAAAPPEPVSLWRSKEADIHWKAFLRYLRQDRSIERLLVSGGSELNADLLAEDLVDELYLTVAPKVKLGRDLPTYAGGEALPADALLTFYLLSCLPVGDEVFLRYRRRG